MEVYEPEIRIPPNGRPFSSYDGLRGMFERNKREQIRAAKKASLPFVGVLARTNSDVDFGADLVAGAMFGDLTFRVPLAEDGESFDIERGVTTFGSGGRMQRGQMRGVSAVAILRRFNPTADLMGRPSNPRKSLEYVSEQGERDAAPSKGTTLKGPKRPLHATRTAPSGGTGRLSNPVEQRLTPGEVDELANLRTSMSSASASATKSQPSWIEFLHAQAKEHRGHRLLHLDTVLLRR
jgi:hypothetical protein